MNIELKRNYGFELLFEAENVRIAEDIESREYAKDENGKSIINLNPKRDIKTDILEQFTNLLDELIYYRVAEFDSSNLIERLFEKLPSDVAIKLADKIKRDYNS